MIQEPGTRKENLEANSYIHCKDWTPRTVEAMVIKEMTLQIEEATSILQIGGRAGHRPQEYIFCIKSMIGRYEMKKTLIIIIVYDILAFFNKDILVDAMQELHKIGVDPLAHCLFHKLNKGTRVQAADTAVGVRWWDMPRQLWSC